MSRTPTADSYVDASQPNLNFGTSTQLRVDGSPVLTAYLRFDLSGLNGPVSSAQLRVFAASAQTVGYTVQAVADASWIETGITASNAPPAGATLGASGPIAAGTWTAVDVTNAVTAGTASFQLATTNGTAISLSSRTGANPPQLVITTTPAQARVNSVLPVISGTTTVGSMLTASDGTWSGSPPPTFSRQWQRCDATCVDIAGATGSSYLLVSADAGQKLQVVVAASNSAGTASATSALTATIAAQTSDPMVATAGDIACDPADVLFNGGAGKSTNCAQRAVSDLIYGKGFSAVLPLGDNQYYCGGLSDFQQSYDLSWGRLLSITHPVIGNHEYLTSGGTGCDSTGAASGYFSYFGSRAGSVGKGYYSYDVGSWHLIALNGSCSRIGGCGSSSPQGKWLAADLASHSNTCTLAYWHVPLFSSGGRSSSSMKPFWTALYNAGADVVLNGHLEFSP